MCDTFVAINPVSSDSTVIFGKNSDRRVNEPHIMIHAPRGDHRKDSRIKATYISIPQVSRTHEVLLFKPAWIWGAEMGCNEFGLCIGNEAVFSKEPLLAEALIGMDYVRLALERCESAREALEFITGYMQIYGQGGNCVYREDVSYHNAFILADPHEAYVLETAGSYWAAVRVYDKYAISNCLSIGSQFDFSHPGLVEHAIEMGWCQSKSSFDFSLCYGDLQFMATTGGAERKRLQESYLLDKTGIVTVDDAKKILRLHDKSSAQDPFSITSKTSVCMHGGCGQKNQTTGSFIAKLGKTNDYWATGASLPCVSAFKPVCFEECDVVFKEDETGKAVDFWMRRELLRRAATMRVMDFNELRNEALWLEARFQEFSNAGAGASKKAFELEEELVAERLKKLDKNDLLTGHDAQSGFAEFWIQANTLLSQ